MLIQEEKLSCQLLEEMSPLLKRHYEEIAEHKELMKLNPDYTKYYELERLGMLHTVTVRDEGRLIGYCITFTTKHLHYKDCLMGLNDILFIDKPERNGLLAIRLLKYVEDALRERGVQIIHYSMNVCHDHEQLFKRLGYEYFEKIYRRVL